MTAKKGISKTEYIDKAKAKGYTDAMIQEDLTMAEEFEKETGNEFVFDESLLLDLPT